MGKGTMARLVASHLQLHRATHSKIQPVQSWAQSKCLSATYVDSDVNSACLHDSLNSQNFFSKEGVSEEVTEATKIRKCAQTASATGAGPQPQEAWLQPSLSQLSFYLAEYDLVHKHLDNTGE